MVVVRVLVFLAGTALIVAVVSSAVRTMIVPRGIPAVLARGVFVVMRRLFRALTPRKADYRRRDRVMTYYAPMSLVALPMVWLTIVATGYAALYWALGLHSLRAAFRLSGSSLFTLGFVTPRGAATHVLVFTEAGAGVGLLALLITYLPSLYSTFSRREAAVALLESRAGGAGSRFGFGPSGVELLWRFHTIGLRGGLDEVWEQWENWFVDLEETHTSLPALSFFRSPQPDRSWVTAAGAVLDGAALYVSTVKGAPDPQAQLCIRAGYLALRHIADFFDITYDTEPQRGDPIAVTREEWDKACDYLQQGDVPVREDRDAAWLDFAGWRVNYEQVLLALAGLTMAPPAVWSGDRASPFHRPRLTAPLRGRHAAS
ncbi:MAG: hypothetical protein QOK43_2524 [Acidimicrobiaceae bacterium]|nr:hypothetical protein [Acidimicrobiaceae bacterium]